MPQTVALAVAFVASNAAAFVGASVATQAIIAGAIVSSVGVGVIGAGLSLGIGLAGQKILGREHRKNNASELPSAADGKVNQKQNVPSRSYVYGRVRKAGDIVFLEEHNGTAYMVIVHASHKIDRYVQHFLSEAAVRIDGQGNVTKSLSEDEDASKYYRHDGQATVVIKERPGSDIGIPYSELVSKFGKIWSRNHRGDNIASVLMCCKSVNSQDHTTVYPAGFPAITSVIKGKPVYDPRTDTHAYSENLALHRLDLLLAPYGGGHKPGQINMDTFRHAADVCDRRVKNINGNWEPLYHGGLYARENNDPTVIGRMIDEAAEMVLYTDADGRIAVHAGEWVEPDIHLTTKNIIGIEFQANRSPSTNVKTVRGLWINPDLDYNEDDAVIYGEPYVSDGDPRSKTIDNACVQRHNHIRRMMKLAYIRARAPRVKISCDYFATEQLPFRRFIKVTDRPHLVDSYLELIGTPTFDLSTFTHQFEAIVVPHNLYEFDPSEEGEKGDPPIKLGSQALPGIDEFSIAMQQQGSSIIAVASFSRLHEALNYELEYVKTSGGAAKYVQANANAASIETEILAENIEYRFRMRTRSVFGQNSDWSDLVIMTATI